MAQWSEEKAAKLIKAAHGAKLQSDDLYREAMEQTFPERENFYKRAEGQQRSKYNWDSQAKISILKGASNLAAGWTPQHTPWAEIGLGPAANAMSDDQFREMLGRTKEEASLQLEGITATLQAVFKGPGFPTSANEMYIDWQFGQGGMQVMPNDDFMGEPVIFSSMPISSFYAYEGVNGRLDRWFFWHEIRADVITSQWQDAELSAELTEKAAEITPPVIDLCSVCYRDYDQRDGQAAYRYEVFAIASDGKSCTRIVERTSNTSPFVTPRHTKLAGDNRGIGPVIFAMPDIRTANKIVEMTLRAVAIAVGGIYTQTEGGVIGPVNLKPHSVISVRSNGGPSGPSLQRLDNPQRIDFGELVLDNLHMTIKQVIGDNSLPSEAGPVRTATEFIQRARELVVNQSGGLGRLYSEFNIPLIQRVIDILESKSLIQTNGLRIDQFLIEARMISPLAAGEDMTMVENIIRFVEMLTMLTGEGGAAVEMNMQRTVKEVADLMNIPVRIRNTEGERNQVMKAAAEAAKAEAGAAPQGAEQPQQPVQAVV